MESCATAGVMGMADYKPGDLLVGIVDFFAIVLPGAVLAFVGMKFEKKIFDGSILPTLGEGPPRWIAFILAAYLVGNIVYLLGASILDPIYAATYRRRKSRQTGDLLYGRVKDLKQAALLEQDQIENCYKWSRATVKIKNTAAAAEIDRLEASSKFFRSMVIVLFLNLFVLAMDRSRWPLHLCLMVLLFSYLRYADMNISELQAKGYLSPSVFVTRLMEAVKKIQRYRWLIGGVFWLAVLALVGMVFWRKSEWLLLSACLLMLYLSFWCYASQRWKMTQSAYLYFVLLSSSPDGKEKGEKSSSGDE
jgi:hypothetical protein